MMPRNSQLQQTPTSIEHGRFDTAALQSELAAALEEDRKYKLTDNMKKRAIHTAANYDEFKNLVACADLKPVSQRELQNFSKAERSTNLAYRKAGRQKTFGSSLQFKPTATVDTPPSTSVEFCRQWRRHLKSSAAKYKYLKLTTAERLEGIFKSDIDAELLADIVKVLVSSLTREDDNNEQPSDAIGQATFALDCLRSLAKTARFTLIIDFLDNAEMELVRDLFTLLQDQISDKVERDDLEELQAQYKV